jgi:hypothetical protein
MDVQADQTELRADPLPTAVVRRTDTTGQGQLFADAYPTYADTDQIPALGKGGSRRPPPRTSRLLRLAVVVVALAVVAGGVALGLVKAGIIASTGTANQTSTTTLPAHHAAPPPSTTPVATQVSSGSGTATYAVDIAAYAVTVTTSTSRSWISIGASGQHPTFAGILSPNSSQRVVLLGPSQVDVGAGGTKVTITSGRRSTVLTPPSAPFTYQFQLKQS